MYPLVLFFVTHKCSFLSYLPPSPITPIYPLLTTCHAHLLLSCLVLSVALSHPPFSLHSHLLLSVARSLTSPLLPSLPSTPCLVCRSFTRCARRTHGPIRGERASARNRQPTRRISIIIISSRSVFFLLLSWATTNRRWPQPPQWPFPCPCPCPYPSILLLLLFLLLHPHRGGGLSLSVCEDPMCAGCSPAPHDS